MYTENTGSSRLQSNEQGNPDAPLTIDMLHLIASGFTDPPYGLSREGDSGGPPYSALTERRGV